ncbi:NUDIX hydrolase [Shimia aestuarii]|uniref:8-oxo-dGTP diphosphatase n=1 Tax=Shimia aestuarii TaxID=254406 RepID=A0A1I4S632_9RHOB|nr:NUDIX hydrolase [Shimia aestuarii]SFM59909.1 8-oxo-dGTP diphosphatase [Shimia aestuarii]
MSVSFDGDEDTVFHGAKLALFIGANLITILRDDKPDIPWPAHWDLPGGGREGDETGAQCVLRETREELGLILPEAALSWGRLYWRKGRAFWFFAAQMPAETLPQIRFGSEGQRWEAISPREYLTRELAIPQFQSRLADYLAERG